MAQDKDKPRLWGLITDRVSGRDGSTGRLLPDSITRPSVRGVGAVAALALLGALALGSLNAVASETGVTALPSVEDAPVAHLPLEVNERVRYWLKRFTTDQRTSFETFLAREGVFGEIIRGKLRARNMPEELIYLAMIESGFRPRATSQVSAVGVWQFMGPTAQAYGLRVDEWVDERRDPIRATDAALDYIQHLYDRYDSWYLAAAAYNAGPSRVDRALRRGAEGRTGEEALFWEIQDHLPRETREYVPRMIAATMLARQAEAYGFGHVVHDTAYDYDRVWVPGGTALSRVATAVESDNALLRSLNPHLIRGAVPPGASYELRVPVGTTRRVVASIGGGPWGVRATDD